MHLYYNLAIRSVSINSNRKISNWASRILQINMLLICPYCLKFQIARVWAAKTNLKFWKLTVWFSYSITRCWFCKSPTPSSVVVRNISNTCFNYFGCSSLVVWGLWENAALVLSNIYLSNGANPSDPRRASTRALCCAFVPAAGVLVYSSIF